MQTFTTTHESSLHFDESLTGPTGPTPLTFITPYRHPTFRLPRRYFDRINRSMDRSVTWCVNSTDGLLENTFIFYFGDHGGVLPRGKGYLYETGLHVPLVIRIPETWRERLPLKVGTRPQGFVSFIDFGPTLLHLAGLPIPAVMDGNPFLGELFTPARLESRDEAFGHADRLMKYEMVRSLRKGSIKYIRNFSPSAQMGFRTTIDTACSLMPSGGSCGRQTQCHSKRLFPAKPVKMLFDLQEDPDETNNLAQNPGHAALLEVMRDRLSYHMNRINDLSLYPESEMIEHALEDGIGYGHEHQQDIRQLLRICNLALEPFDQAERNLMRARTEDPTIRYWALTVCSIFGERRQLCSTGQGPAQG